MKKKPESDTEKLKEMAWNRVRELMQFDIFNNLDQFNRVVKAAKSTCSFLTDTCGLTEEESSAPIDIREKCSDAAIAWMNTSLKSTIKNNETRRKGELKWKLTN